MPVSDADWARETREQHRRESVWEPWGRDADYPDPSEDNGDEEDPTQWEDVVSD